MHIYSSASVLCLYKGIKGYKYADMVHKYPATETPKKSHRVAIVGVRGYSGLELARILLKHPGVELAECFSTDKAYPLSQLLQDEGAEKIQVKPVAQWDGTASFNTVFLATPAEASLELAPKFLKAGVKVIDLSGAFRLKSSSYPEWYGFEHAEKALLADAQYGLVPFCGPKAAQLISNPGCYATAVLFGLIPLLKAGAIDPATLVIDAKSGTTGAGKKLTEGSLFSEVDGECLPYKVGKHQHLPEIQEYAKAFGGVATDPFFTTHLLPTRRGIIAGLYAKLKPGADVGAAYAAAFKGYPLVKVERIDSSETSNYALSLKRIAGSSMARIGYQNVGDKLYVFSLIDNLLKGAASQAVENLNRSLDLPVDTGLRHMEGSL
jgi:N-acetyl-gamma-glutamyl-phosphate reductase